MPVVLSIVVPVYRVEDYLRQCLDSILDGLTDEQNVQVEVIAVDDASPDSCGRLLDAYGKGLRVLHLRENVGLGPARNAGLYEAEGEYVWFVDSDDWLPAGSVAAVLAELTGERPDVLLIDHLRMHEDGRAEVDASSHLLSGPIGLAEMLGVQHTAWNRIVRRDLLLSNDLFFRGGWYEDVSFSHPVLLAAGRIAALDRVCYHYRIGRPGAITSTRSDRHFEAFDQYDHLQSWIADHGVDERIRARLFHLMISHLLVVVGNEHRMHPSHRRRFFRGVVALYRRHRPAGHRPANLKHRLVALGSYPLYALLRAAYRGRRRPEPTPPVSRPVAAPQQPAQAASIA